VEQQSPARKRRRRPKSAARKTKDAAKLEAKWRARREQCAQRAESEAGAEAAMEIDDAESWGASAKMAQLAEGLRKVPGVSGAFRRLWGPARYTRPGRGPDKFQWRGVRAPGGRPGYLYSGNNHVDKRALIGD